jgi:hypothetical protein
MLHPQRGARQGACIYRAAGRPKTKRKFEYRPRNPVLKSAAEGIGMENQASITAVCFDNPDVSRHFAFG